MKQISKLKKTLKEISPRWDHYFKTGEKDKQLEMKYNSRCVVGEAHGFPDKADGKPWYGCNRCYGISMCFNFASDGYIHCADEYGWHGQSLDEMKQEFEDHWNEKHDLQKM